VRGGFERRELCKAPRTGEIKFALKDGGRSVAGGCNERFEPGVLDVGSRGDFEA
jgi:hypothetical protein